MHCGSPWASSEHRSLWFSVLESQALGCVGLPVRQTANGCGSKTPHQIRDPPVGACSDRRKRPLFFLSPVGCMCDRWRVPGGLRPWRAEEEDQVETRQTACDLRKMLLVCRSERHLSRSSRKPARPHITFTQEQHSSRILYGHFLTRQISLLMPFALCPSSVMCAHQVACSSCHRPTLQKKSAKLSDAAEKETHSEQLLDLFSSKGVHFSIYNYILYPFNDCWCSPKH